MDIDRLVVVAKKIDEAAEQRERRTGAMLKLAHDARTRKDLYPGELAERKHAVDHMVVFDLGDLVAELRAALRARARKQKTT